jgi:hypothetical protein
MQSLAELEALDESQRLERLQPVDALLQSALPKMMVEGEAAERFSHGNPVERPNGLAGKIRVYADDRSDRCRRAGFGWPPVAKTSGAIGYLSCIILPFPLPTEKFLTWRWLYQTGAASFT